MPEGKSLTKQEAQIIMDTLSKSLNNFNVMQQQQMKVLVMDINDALRPLIELIQKVE